MALKITLVSGTNREGAYSLKLAKALQKFPELAGVEIQLLDLAQLPIEVFLPNCYYSKPKEFDFWQQTIDYSDGIIFCIPEYNAGIPGILKHFIDILRYPGSFHKKPVALIGLTSSRSEKSRVLASMSTLMEFLQADIFDNQVFISQCKSAISDDDEITDGKITDLLSQQLNGFIKKCQFGLSA